MDKRYLRAKNILLIILAWICLIFINPGGNSWIIDRNEYLDDWIIYFIGEAIFLTLCFSFKSIIDRNYRNVIRLSIFGLINLGSVYYLVFGANVNMSLVPFFHPISLVLPTIFIMEKKIHLAIVGYAIGYLFSFMPLIGSLVPILFLQLWLDSLKNLNTENKISRFLSRALMYFITSGLISFFIFGISKSGSLFPTVSFSKLHEITMTLLSFIAIYLILYQYLKLYYEKYGNGVLRTLSYIPIIWLIPLFEILLKGNERNLINE